MAINTFIEVQESPNLSTEVHYIYVTTLPTSTQKQSYIETNRWNGMGN